MVFISHDLDEIKEKCDTLTVLRDGHIIRTFEREEYDDDAIRASMIGCGSSILILDCPTRGIDVGVKQTMYHMMYEMKQQGKTIIMISEEMTELMGMSDRLIIMKDGRITKEFSRSPDLSDAEIIQYMI